MFYNTYRTTKAAMRERQTANLTGAGQSIINPRERLLNLQKRERLKGLLITKFCRKYGIEHPEEILEGEVEKFLNGERLTEADIQRLDAKIRQLLIEKNKLANLQNDLRNQTEYNQNRNFISPNANDPNYQNTMNTLNTLNPNTFQNDAQSMLNAENKRVKKGKIVYIDPEEELAELEAEEAAANPKIDKLDFSKYGNEWNAINKYKKLMFDLENEEQQIRDEDNKRRLKEELQKQMKEKYRKIYEEELKDAEYKKIMEEHNKKMREIDRQKEIALEKQKQKLRESRAAQIEDKRILARIEELKTKRYERKLKEQYEKEQEELRQKELENQRLKDIAFQEILKDNALRRKILFEKEKKEKEDDKKMAQEQRLVEEKKEMERRLYFKRIERNAANFMSSTAKEALDKMKREQEEEDRKILEYTIERNKKEREKLIKDEQERERKKEELAKFLEMQIAEKKKQEEFEEQINHEQSRIFRIDDQKYRDDQKIIEQKIDRMNKRNLEKLLQQIRDKREKEMKEQDMTPDEIEMNRKYLDDYIKRLREKKGI
jgi:hypothetical protein